MIVLIMLIIIINYFDFHDFGKNVYWEIKYLKYLKHFQIKNIIMLNLFKPIN